jgi:hypothetical protein
MTRTSTHAPRNTPLMQFLTSSMVSTSYIRLTLYYLLIKAKLKLSLHATQTNDGAKVQLHVFLNSALNEGGRSSSHDGQCVRTNTAGTHWAARCVGLWARRDAMNKTSFVSDRYRTPNPRSRSNYLRHFSLFPLFIIWTGCGGLWMTSLVAITLYDTVQQTDSGNSAGTGGR